jgi:hypothetical protein
MLKQPHSDLQELQNRLRKHGVLAVPSLRAVATASSLLSTFADSVRSSGERYRGYAAPTFWPCHRIWDMLEALIGSGETGAVFDFFNDLAGLEFLSSRRRIPTWFTPKPSLVLATIATLGHRQRFLKRMKGFSGKGALTDAELWAGIVVSVVSFYIRDEILAALRASSTADMCEFCHRLILHKRKYCTNACMQASNDRKKRLRKRTRSSA